MFKEIGPKPSRGQIVKSHEISVFIMLCCWINQAMGMVSVDLMVPKQLLFACSIFNFIIHDY